MIEIDAIDHVVLRVIDAEAMERFYRDVLGCTVDTRREDLGMVQLRAGASLIDLVRVDGRLGLQGGPAPEAQGHNMDHLCLRVAHYDEPAILEHLRAHDVRIGALGTRRGALGTGPSVYLYDPQGNTVELKGPAGQ
ncbi:VOC family protein [Saccharothrix sp. ST-888]|uniref:VOC family protein n=1 Tax=Saccharothrix sp. ST-888 TaxID=1427391 RepID=UPI0005EC027B|nr:VOC family protein [Saccharothrix sp. ST-888]KJK59451.1 lactoylglutathione lyase [Saccharothrix sp. ST-888]